MASIGGLLWRGLLAAMLVAALATATCDVSPLAPAYVLPNSSWDLSGHGMCRPGWYCPNSTLANQTTWPAICPPTTKCIADRLNRKFCPPQGTFEPQPCPGGWYCPRGDQKIRCPKGYACTLGSVAPSKCSSLSICPEGASNEYFMGGILAVILMDAAVIAAALGYRWWSARDRESSSKLVAHAARGWSDLSSIEQQQLVRCFTRARGESDPIAVTFRNLSLTIPATRKAEAKQLLRGVTGQFRPGHTTAIMGPSGAGKTIFLSTVLGKTDPSWTREGDLDVNGHDTIAAFRHVVGFVPQDDVLHGELSVEQNLYYSSEVRLPSDWTAAERAEVREAVLTALGLQHVKHVAIGDSEARGVSGGQRKRANVALELAALPSALFLDEPTTGLDASTALELMTLLKAVADATQLTVGMVIHQPRVEIWEALDEVLFLAPGGRTVYQGPQRGAQRYFETALPTLNFSIGNPADIILDGIAANGEQLVKAWDEHLAEITEPARASGAGIEEDHRSRPSHSSDDAPPPRQASFLKQIVLNHRRALVKQYARAWTLVFDVVLSVIASTLMGSAVIRERNVGVVIDDYILLSPRHYAFMVPMLALFYLLAISAAVAPGGVRTFGNEQPQYWREASSGHSRLAYFIGYSTADAYRLVLSSFHFALIAYLIWEPIQTFGTFYLLLLLVFACVDSQSVIVSMVVNPNNAPLIATVVAVFVTLLNGYANIPVISPASYTWWMTEGLVSNEAMPQRHVYTTSTYNRNWNYNVDRFGIDILFCVASLLVFRVIAFVLMIALNREKQR